MTVTNAWCGAVTSTSARVRAKVTGTSTRLAVSTMPDLTGAAYYGPVAPSLNIATLDATGLTAATQYYWAIEDNGVLDTASRGRFRTLPVEGEPADYFFAAIGDAGLSPTSPGVGTVLASDRLSNHTQFDVVRALDPDMVIHVGDICYYDLGSDLHGIVGGGSLANYRRMYDDVLLQPRQHQLYREAATAYVWDDHDFGPNNSDSTAPGRANARTVYRERVPHYPLPAGTGDNSIYQSFQVGRVLVMMADVRSARDPNSAPSSSTKTMLGTGQKAWMESLLTSTTAEALIWIMPGQWMDVDSTDTWTVFQRERDELVQLFGDTGWLRRMCTIGGDTHAQCLDTGRGNRWGGFPVFQVASVDATPSGPSFDYDTGLNNPTRDARGEFRIRDRGHTIEVEGRLLYGTDTLYRAHTWQAHIGTPVIALNYSAGHLSPPLEPVEDDQSTRNDVTATRQDGGSTRIIADTGPLSVQPPPDGVGTYDTDVTVNVAYDEQLGDQASWRVHLGTVDEPRFPTVPLNLARNADLIDVLAGLESGDKVTIDGVLPTLPPGLIELLALGYSETIDPFTWDLTLTCAPGSPWTIGEVVAAPEDAGPDSPNRVDTSGSQLQDDITDTATSFLVRTDQSGITENAVWVTDGGPTPTSGA